MSNSHRQGNGVKRKAAGLRRLHRWLGVFAAIFVILLSVTGIALNHTDDWQLDRRYVSWNWLLDAYGITAPVPETGFRAGEHFATRMGRRIYLDQREVAADAGELVGFVMTGEVGAIALPDVVLLLTPGGDVVDRLDLSPQMPAGIGRLGTLDGRLVVSGPDGDFASDVGLTRFEPTNTAGDVDWSETAEVPGEMRSALREQYRGRGLSVERVLTDIHSGRIVGVAGRLTLDLIGVFLIVLSLTGILLWLRRRAADNGNGRRQRP